MNDPLLIVLLIAAVAYLWDWLGDGPNDPYPHVKGTDDEPSQ